MNPTPVNAVLLVNGLRFHYPGQAALFDDWSARVAPGITLVRGGESRGKTTLLRLLAGDLAATAGRLQINGVPLDQSASAYRQQVFWTDARSDAFDQLSARAYLASLGTRYANFDPQAVAPLLDGLSLTGHQHKPLYMLSTGSKRKVWLTAAFACGAPLTLLDDPFAALDKASIRFVTERLATEAAQSGSRRAWLIADHAAPESVSLAAVIDLGE
jgi:ABC-type multidrug transport system ATPase subunit